MRVSLTLDRSERELMASRFCFTRPDLAALPGAGQILVLPLETTEAAPTVDALHLFLDGNWYTWTGTQGMAIRPDLTQRLPEKLATLSQETQQMFRQFWVEDCAQAVTEREMDPVYRRNDSTVDRLVPPPVLEEPEPEPEEELLPCIADPRRPFGVGFEQVVAVDAERLFLRGWMWDTEDVVERLDLITSSGARSSVLESLARAERVDVAELYRPHYGDRTSGRHGFFGLVPNPRTIEGEEGYRLEIHSRGGEPQRVGEQSAISDPYKSRNVVLDCVPWQKSPDLRLLERHFAPALELIQARCAGEVSSSHDFTHGDLPASPVASLVIPLFRRLDLMEHQLVQLADEPARAGCEVIYVLDSPSQGVRFEEMALHLSRLYQVPIRGVVLSHSSGYAGAVNVGVAHARGRLLVIMHSDVLPAQPGWLETLIEFYDSSESIGIVGPKLLYDDQAIQDAGVVFSRDHFPEALWSAVHLFKGLPGRLEEATVARCVPSLSGACMVIDRALFEKIGRFSAAYAGGDLEAADLCLRCREMGYESWCLPSAELFHLEGASQQPGSGWRRNPWTQLYDRWLLTRRWSKQIQRAMEQFEASVEVGH